jgi:hypothetical protein
LPSWRTPATASLYGDEINLGQWQELMEHLEALASLLPNSLMLDKETAVAVFQ